MTLSLFPSYAAGTRNSVDALFESLWENTKAQYRNATLSPRVDVFDEEENLVVVAEMPGVKKEDVEVTVERGVLTIKAAKKAPEGEPKSQYLSERVFGTYERSFRVSDSIDTESVHATFEEGVLKLVLQRKPEAASKRISVQ